MMQDLDNTVFPPRYHLACIGQMAERVQRAAVGDHVTRAKARIECASELRLPAYQYRPLPQAERFHRSQSRRRFMLGGNRSSKSYSLAMETLWAATGLHPWRKWETPNHGWYATTFWDKVGDTLWGPTLAPLLHGFKYEIAWHFKGRNIPEFVFVQPAQRTARKFWSKIQFKAFDQGRESFQAAAPRYIHNDEQFPRDIWTEQTSRVGSAGPLDIACSFTPINPQPWLEEALENRPPSWDVFELPLDDNRISRGGFIADEAIDAMIAGWPPEVRETRRRGRWGAFLGTIFQTYSREIHVVNEELERRVFFKGDKVNPHMVVRGAIDWGGNNPFVFLWGVQVPWLDNAWYIFDLYYWNFAERGPRRLEEHADEIKARTTAWGTRLDRVWADHDPTDAREMAHYGVPSRPAKKGADADEANMAGIEALWALLAVKPHLATSDFPNGRSQIFFAARCKDLLRELPVYRWEEGSEKRDARRRPIKVNDHAIDALRYLVASEAKQLASSRPIPNLPRYPKQF